MVVWRGGQTDVLRAFHSPEGRMLRGALRAEECGRKYAGLTRGLRTVSVPERQELSIFTSRRLALRAGALSFHSYLRGRERTAGGGVFLLDGGSRERQQLLLGTVASLVLLQLQPQLLHLPLFLLEFPGELIDHLLLLHQHLVLLGVQSVQLGRDGTPI